jgi:hypothetical protein
MKLTKETLKRIIKEELEKVINESIPDGGSFSIPDYETRMTAQKASSEKEREKVNQQISSKIGGLQGLVDQIAKDFKEAMGSDLIPGNVEMKKKFMQGHAARQLDKWYAKNLPGLSGYKNEVFASMAQSLPRPLSPDSWEALWSHDDEALKRIFGF